MDGLVFPEGPHKEAQLRFQALWGQAMDHKVKLTQLHQKALAQMPVHLSTDRNFRKWLRKLKTVEEHKQFLKDEEVRRQKGREKAKGRGAAAETVKLSYSDPGYWWNEEEKEEVLLSFFYTSKCYKT